MSKNFKLAAALTDAHEKQVSVLNSTIETLRGQLEEARGQAATAQSEVLTAAANAKAKDAEIAALKADAAEMCTLAGKQSLGEVRGVFSAFKAEVAKVAELTGKLAAIETATAADKLKSLVAKGVAEGKITPAEEPAFLKADISFVETILAVRPAVVKTTPTEQKKPEETPTVLNISDELKDLAKSLGWDAAKLQAEIAAGRTPSLG